MRKQHSTTSDPARGFELPRDDRGIVLILVLMVIMVLSVMATAFLFLSGTESAISRNSQVVTQGFYAAEAGIDTAINQLPNIAPIPPNPGDPLPVVDPNNPNVVFQTGPPGTPALPSPPIPIVELGASTNPPAGFNLANYSFNMYRVGVSGIVRWPGVPPRIIRSVTQLEVGSTIGSPQAGTSY